MRFAERRARKLARTLAYAMSRYGGALEKKQGVLFRLVDVGAELFAMAATSAYAVKLRGEDRAGNGPIKMADLFCRHARRRIDERFDRVFDNDDTVTYRLAQEVLEGKHAWLEHGIADPPAPNLG